MLCDFWPHGEVAEKYGVFNHGNGLSERANILIDEAGKIAFFKVYPISKLPDIQEINQCLKDLERKRFK